MIQPKVPIGLAAPGTGSLPGTMRTAAVWTASGQACLLV